MDRVPLSGLSAAVIAGGKSKRFGSPKGLARLNGVALIDRALDLAHNFASNVLIVYGREDQYKRSDVRGAADLLPDAGPAGGVYTALARAETAFVATLPCDTPLLTAEVYQVLYGRRRASSPVYIRHDSGIEPLVAVWPAALAGPLADALREGRRTLHKLLEDFDASAVDARRCVPGYRPEHFFNVNRPGDLSQLRELLQRET